MRPALVTAMILLLSFFGCSEPEPEVEEPAVTEETAPEVIEDETIDLGDAEVIEAAEETGTVDVTTERAEDPETPVRRTTPATTPPRETPAAAASEAPAREADTPRAVPEPAPAPPAAEPARETAPAEAPSKRPKNHTVDNGGVLHAPGQENPERRCVACHGKDLRGGKAGVGCFECHDKNWE